MARWSAVGGLGAVGAPVLLGDLLDQHLDLGKVLVGHLRGGQCRCLALEQQPRLGQFERGHVEAGTVVLAGQPLDIGARADPHLDQPLHFERDDRLAHRRPAHLVAQRKVALGRQAAAHRIAPAGQFIEQRAGEILIEPVV